MAHHVEKTPDHRRFFFACPGGLDRVMSVFDLLLVAWFASLIVTGTFLARRQMTSARRWAMASVILSVFCAIFFTVLKSK
jgi:hypothetical protein